MVAAARGGHSGRAAFEQLAERHSPWIIRTVEYLLGSRSDAEDVTQDALLRAYSAMERCPPSAFRPWLRVIATRLAYNHRRAAVTRRGYHERLGEVTASRSVATERLEQGDIIEAALGSISYPYREVLVLRYIDEMSVAEISDALGIGVSATKMRLLRAREEFKVAYDRHRSPGSAPRTDDANE